MSSSISIGKYGSFQTNHIIGRPFHLTFEILENTDLASSRSPLRIIPAAELYANIIEDGDANALELTNGRTVGRQDGVEYEVVGQNGEVVLRTNRNIIDDTGTQSMSMDEIEALKAEGIAGKDLIAKILDSHTALDQKTAFALSKYTLRKAKKYLKRFTILPLDVSILTRYILEEKEPMKIMELREEMIALIGSWSNIRYTVPDQTSHTLGANGEIRAGRWLMIDETGGLLVAAMAERMGLLDDDDPPDREPEMKQPLDDGEELPQASEHPGLTYDIHQKTASLSNINSITAIHGNSQPNLSLLKYFNFDAASPSSSHPLHRHLKTVSWLQLIAPEDDSGYLEPDTVSDETLRSWKSSKRGNYHRKRRRWERIKSVVDETREGGFDGLIIASFMSLTTILQHTVPLLRGGAQVVIYSPTVEPLVELSDYYSTARRTAFVTGSPDQGSLPLPDFPVNPTSLLAPSIQTVRCKSWQVLPGRTHPHMTGRGGAEGYLFTATRVLPAEGKIEARGNFKRRKTGVSEKVKTSVEPKENMDTGR